MKKFEYQETVEERTEMCMPLNIMQKNTEQSGNQI